MAYLEPEQIQEIHTHAVNTPGLLDQWRNLLVGIPIGYTSMLPNIDSDKNMGLFAQLDKMNEVAVLKGGVVPLERWLKNAAYFSDQFPEHQEVFQRHAMTVAEQRAAAVKKQPAATESPAVPSAAQLGNIPEKVIFTNDMVSFGFLAAAARVGNSVARLTVPRFQGGGAAMLPFSTQQLRYFGTGWLIGTRHLITNHHVINARDDGEADASPADFELQGKGASVQFDYNQNNAAGDVRTVKAVVAASKALDYSILELTEDTGRESLPLSGRELILPLGSYIPVNLVQHPGGQPKKLGIRNNLVATIKQNDIAYFTDTEAGSSGSPVCTDDWRVVGLHKASSASFGEFEFQGKKTAWVNVGTRIDRIISDLTSNHADLWKSIGAMIVS
jgi:endonuclease G